MHARALIRADTDSPKETELRLLLVRAGLPEPAINMPMFDETGGWIQDPDMSYEDYKIAIQYDGGHHSSPAQRRSDIFRDEDARGLGWLVVVLTQWDLDPFRSRDGAQGGYTGAGGTHGPGMEASTVATHGHIHPRPRPREPSPFAIKGRSATKLAALFGKRQPADDQHGATPRPTP